MRQMLAALGAMLLLAGTAQAQEGDPARFDKRVGKLESEMRAVQRKVFPGADARFFDPEITAVTPPPATVGTPASAPLTDFADRLGELERQVRTLTGQVEANEFKLRQIEDAQTKQRADVEFRLGALEVGGRPPSPAGPAVEAPEAAPKADAVKVPPKPKPTADAAWRAAYANVTAKDWPAAETAMTAFVVDWPKSTRLTQAQYWLGRSHAAQEQHAEAARAFLKVYETAPRSPQAPDSLLGLADAMVGLKKPRDACRVLGELGSVYGEKLTAAQTSDLAAQRKRAKCAG